MIKNNESFNSSPRFSFIHVNFDTITQRIETDELNAF